MKTRVIVIAILIVLMYLWRVQVVNEDYKKYTTVYYEEGETFQETELTFCIKGWSEMTYEQFVEQYGQMPEREKEYYQDIDEVFYVVRFEVSNPTDKDIVYDRMSIQLQGETWSQQGAYALNCMLGEEEMNIRIMSGKTCNFSYAYAIISPSFGKRWEEVKEEKKCIVFSQEYSKKVVTLSEETKNYLEDAFLLLDDNSIEETATESFLYEDVSRDACNGVKITWYLGDDAIVKIPEEIDGKPVVEIAAQVFANNETIIYVSIPDTVTHIGEGIFVGCRELRQVRLPKGDCKTIPDYAFSECENLEKMEVPEGYQNIGNYAFEGCKKLQLITLPDTLVEIGNNAFESCGKLEDMNLTMVESVGQSAFMFCAKLEEVHLGAQILALEGNEFLGCDSLESIILDEKNSVFDVEGALLYQGDKVICAMKGLLGKEVSIREETKVIGEAAFWGCDQLEVLKLPASVEQIETLAFSGCSNLRKIFVKNMEMSIAEEAFLNVSEDLTIVEEQ